MADPKPKMFYGWKVVAGILFILTFGTGLSFYNHAVILNALARQPAFTVQSASLAVSLFFLSSGFAGLVVARWIQAFDVRYCISVGAVISCTALASLALVETTWQLYAVYILFGAGFSASNLIPATTLVTRWFHKQRAVALSVASTGLSLGGVVITPVCAILVETLGLATAGPVMGAMYIVGVVPATWLMLRPSPESMGLLPSGTDEVVAKPVHAAIEAEPVAIRHAFGQGASLREARSGRFFWGMSLAYIFLMMAQVGGISHQYGLARELLSEAETAMVVAILPLASIIGRLVGGVLVEQFSTRAFAMVMMVLQGLSLALLSAGFGVLSLCVGLALFGVTVGNLLMLQPLLIAEAFGVKEYARIFSVSNLMTSWGTACGPVLLGIAYAASQNAYAIPYAFASAAGFLGLVLFTAGGKIKRIPDSRV
ncbi:MAG: MFS transporter [Pseudohongiellaceae bacterium]